MGYYYVHVMTPEESAEWHKREVEESKAWWVSLSDEERIRIYKANEKIIRQMNCVHYWHTISFYDEETECCSKCDLIKSI